MNWIYVHDLDPILVTIGPLRVGWYGLMYAISFIAIYLLLKRAARKPGSPLPEEEVPNLLTYGILGVILGGRLGWVIFYGGLPYLMEPWRIVETWKGGMSFHGGLLGVIVAVFIYAVRHKSPKAAMGDFATIWAPVGLFLGRIGNFINGELWGAPTDGTWGVIFPHDPLGVPRHPSQLYEAGMEGVLTLIVLLIVKRRAQRPGYLLPTFFVCYGTVRFLVEFIRLPDADIGYLWGVITMGQVLSLPMIVIGALWILWLYRQPMPPAARG